MTTPSSAPSRAGRLTVVGTGIGARNHIIPAAVAAIADADLVLHQIDDPATADWLNATNPNCRPVDEPTQADALSPTVYDAIAAEVADAVCSGADVCFVTYGHPGIYQHAAHRAMVLVRDAGHLATMVPGISALDCLIADVGVDIATGCCVLDATAIVLHDKALDPSSALVIFQIGIFGNPYLGAKKPVGLDLLVDRLTGAWGAGHEAIVYEAPMTQTGAPIIAPVALRDLEKAPLTARSMLYIPPLAGSSTNVIAAAQLAARLANDRP